MSILVIIPTYNEKHNISDLIKKIFESVPESTNILVVDDSSPDGTGEIVQELANQNQSIHLLSRQGKQGLASAYILGFQWGLQAGYQYLIQMDADFSHHPKYLQPMIDHLQNYDYVIGSRYVSGGGVVDWGLGRKLISKMGSLYARFVLWLPIQDFTGGFNGWNSEVLEHIDLGQILSKGYLFQIEMKYRAFQKGYRFLEFPIIFEDRKLGNSKMSKNVFWEALIKIWKLRAKNE